MGNGEVKTRKAHTIRSSESGAVKCGYRSWRDGSGIKKDLSLVLSIHDWRLTPKPHVIPSPEESNVPFWPPQTPALSCLYPHRPCPFPLFFLVPQKSSCTWEHGSNHGNSIREGGSSKG